jgi:hypothetical protein
VLRAVPSNTYMVRVTLLYANFLAAGAPPPIFYLEIDAVTVAEISFTETTISNEQYYEAYLSATRDTIYVCLARVTGVPFISSLELRDLDTVSMNRIVQQGLFLKNIYHANFGSTTPIIRYL